MPSSVSSNIKSANTVVNLSNDGGNRLSTQILASQVLNPPGISAGNAIHYSIADTKYRQSKADNPATAEVFGVVESIDLSGNLNVVMLGSIALTGGIQIGDGGSGGHDIFFLSGMTAGVLQSLPPTDPNHIVKPVYQVAPHGNYTGMVMNYIGYRVPIS
jgi:hypothetical protein